MLTPRKLEESPLSSLQKRFPFTYKFLPYSKVGTDASKKNGKNVPYNLSIKREHLPDGMGSVFLFAWSKIFIVK